MRLDVPALYTGRAAAAFTRGFYFKISQGDKRQAPKRHSRTYRSPQQRHGKTLTKDNSTAQDEDDNAMMPPSGVRGVRCSGRRAGDASASSSSSTPTDESETARSSIESAAEAKPPSKKRQHSNDGMHLPLREGLPWTCKCGEVLAARELLRYRIVAPYFLVAEYKFNSYRIRFVVRRAQERSRCGKCKRCVGRPVVTALR